MSLRRISRTLVLCLALLALPTFGCNWYTVQIVIPDFESSLVEGVHVWRESSTTGAFDILDGELFFGDPGSLANGVETIPYEVVRDENNHRYEWFAQIERDPANPDQVVLDLIYSRGVAPGTYWRFKVTTFNTAGDSPLSLETFSGVF